MDFETFLTFQIPKAFFIISPRRGDFCRTCPAEMFALSLVPSMLGPFSQDLFKFGLDAMNDAVEQ